LVISINICRYFGFNLHKTHLCNSKIFKSPLEGFNQVWSILDFFRKLLRWSLVSIIIPFVSFCLSFVLFGQDFIHSDMFSETKSLVPFIASFVLFYLVLYHSDRIYSIPFQKMNEIMELNGCKRTFNDFISLEYHLSKNISFKYHLTPKLLWKNHFTLKKSQSII
jgi:hypothetical protein